MAHLGLLGLGKVSSFGVYEESTELECNGPTGIASNNMVDPLLQEYFQAPFHFARGMLISGGLIFLGQYMGDSFLQRNDKIYN